MSAHGSTARSQVSHVAGPATVSQVGGGGQCACRQLARAAPTQPSISGPGCAPRAQLISGRFKHTSVECGSARLRRAALFPEHRAQFRVPFGAAVTGPCSSECRRRTAPTRSGEQPGSHDVTGSGWPPETTAPPVYTAGHPIQGCTAFSDAPAPLLPPSWHC